MSVPLLTPKLSSYWVGLFTSVRPSISMPLIEGLNNEVICRDNRIREIMPYRLTPYDEALRIALAERDRGKAIHGFAKIPEMIGPNIFDILRD